MGGHALGSQRPERREIEVCWGLNLWVQGGLFVCLWDSLGMRRPEKKETCSRFWGSAG